VLASGHFHEVNDVHDVQAIPNGYRSLRASSGRRIADRPASAGSKLVSFLHRARQLRAQ
jgi:hypothetical protein